MEMDQYGGNNGSGYHGTIEHGRAPTEILNVTRVNPAERRSVLHKVPLTKVVMLMASRYIVLGFEDVAAEESLPHAAVRLPPINGSSSHGEEALEEGELSSPSSGTVRRMAYSSKENLIKGLDKERRVSFLRMEHEEQSTVAPMRTRKSDMTIKRNLGSAEKRKHIPSLFFDDKERRIDYVMVYKEDEEDQDRFLKAEKRRVFQENLTTRGLHLEVEDKQYSSDGKLFFVKVHIPWEVLTEYAEVLNIKMPIKKVSEEKNPRRQKVWGFLTRPFDYNHAFIPSEPEYFTAGFQRNYEDQFIIKNRDEFFTPAQRSYVVFEILRRASYKQDERQKIHRERDHGEHIPSPSKVSQEESADHHREKVPKFGITRLLNQEVYDAVYPLHDGNLLKSDAPPDGTSNRQLLYSEWARFSNWFKKQPLWLVRRYFGDQLGLYFTWLGFYTKMLIPAAFFGVLIFLIPVFYRKGDWNRPR
ncbi:unnamed protein product [Cyprideis torosa]|uniref:Anoctamin n=1 Tax=Cyprideis torosa TaxID=163714 RepID=A0A7R8ZGY7_9CRUS|nr:unnamed protein product [Cyprideis torosa]CAG0881377.1 unnamed protein product [Cyprideis torosa]